jgi:hypothetical protein
MISLVHMTVRGGPAPEVLHWSKHEREFLSIILKVSEDDRPSFERLGIFARWCIWRSGHGLNWRSHAVANTQTTFDPPFYRSLKIMDQVLKGQEFFVRWSAQYTWRSRVVWHWMS